MTKASNVILFHGAWADGSSRSKVIPILKKHNLRATGVRLPLTSLQDDVKVVEQALAQVEEPTTLVGHSDGGVVITEAGNDPKVVGLVYIAAFAPDVGESAGSLGASVAPAPLGAALRPDQQGFLRITETGVKESFAQDLSASEKGRCGRDPVADSWGSARWKRHQTGVEVEAKLVSGRGLRSRHSAGTRKGYGEKDQSNNCRSEVKPPPDAVTAGGNLAPDHRCERMIADRNFPGTSR